MKLLSVSPLRGLGAPRLMLWASVWEALRASFVLAAVVAAPVLSAAESIEEIFKRALFAEEGHRDFEAAARDYQQVVRAVDEQRRLAATAVFRLGECYRKLNRTNDAVAQYQRVVVEFPAESTLVQISRQNLAVLGAETLQPPAGDGLPSNAVGLLSGPTGSVEGLTARLEQELALLEAQLEALGTMNPSAVQSSLKTFFPNDTRGIIELETRLTEAETQDTRLDASLAEEHPDRVALRRLLSLWRKKLDQEISDIMGSQLARRDVLRTTLKQIRKATPPTVAADAEPSLSPSPTPAATDEEEQEIRRIQTLVANSPDLINANKGKTWPLYAAAQKGQLAVARYLLDHGAKTSLGSQTSTPLHAATEAGHKAMVELLLERGAPVDAGSFTALTPLHIAVRAGFIGIAEVLLAKGADPNAPFPRPKYYLEDSSMIGVPLNSALNLDRLDLVRLLLEKGADPNSRDEGPEMPRQSGNPPLRFAISAETVRLMLAKGANPNLEGRDGSARLHWAAQRGDLEIMDLLLKAGAQPDGATNTTVSALTPVAVAVQAGQKDAAEQLLKHGASIDLVRGGQAPLHVALGKADLDLVTWVLDHGANPNLPNGDQAPPLQLALEWDAGRGGSSAQGIPAMPSGPNPFGRVPVPVQRIPVGAPPGLSGPGAASAVNPVPGKFVALLLERGADIDQQFSDGSKLIHQLSRRELDAAAWARILSRKPDVNARGPRQVTPLMIAVCAGNSDGVKALLDAGVDVNAQEELGNTALHFASNSQSDFVGWLVKAKADPSVTNRFGVTPVDLVRNGGWTQIGRDPFGVVIPSPGPSPMHIRPAGYEKRREELLRQLGVSTNESARTSGGGSAAAQSLGGRSAGLESPTVSQPGVTVIDTASPRPQPNPDRP